MKNKGMFVFLLILFILSLTGGLIGYFQKNMKNTEKPKEPIEEEKVSYVYYLEEVEVEIMPENPKTTDENGVETTEVKYMFSRSSCTNNVSGDFDINTWTFTPTEEKNSTCKLYFVQAKYEVTLTITDGEADEDNETFIEREKDGVFKITPSEGYEFDSSTCSDNKEAIWDASKKELKISTIMKDVTCKVVFKIKNLKMDVTVVNGTGTGTETVEYGESVSAIIEPNTGFEKPTITCTNNQKATYATNKITIEKLTDDTKCTVTFVAIPVEKFSLKIGTLPDTIKITNGSQTQTVESGTTGTFTLKADEGFVIDSISCGDILPSATTNPDGSIKYTFLNIKKNITCNLVSKAIE